MILFLIYIVYIIYYWGNLNANIIFYGALFFIFYLFIVVFYYKKSIRINKDNSIKKFEVINTIRSLFIYLILIILGFYLYDIGIINFDFSFGIETILWFILFVIYHDVFFYIFHRIMHIPIFYKYAHIVHHKSVYSNIMSAYNFGFLEIFIYAIAIVPILFFDLNIYAFLVAIFINDFANIIGHSGYEIFKKYKKKEILKFFQITSYHDLHHTSNNGNYALYFSYLDKLFNTYDKRNKK